MKVGGAAGANMYAQGQVAPGGGVQQVQGQGGGCPGKGGAGGGAIAPNAVGAAPAAGQGGYGAPAQAGGAVAPGAAAGPQAAGGGYGGAAGGGLQAPGQLPGQAAPGQLPGEVAPGQAGPVAPETQQVLDTMADTLLQAIADDPVKGMEATLNGLADLATQNPQMAEALLNALGQSVSEALGATQGGGLQQPGAGLQQPSYPVGLGPESLIALT